MTNPLIKLFQTTHSSEILAASVFKKDGSKTALLLEPELSTGNDHDNYTCTKTNEGFCQKTTYISGPSSSLFTGAIVSIQFFNQGAEYLVKKNFFKKVPALREQT